MTGFIRKFIEDTEGAVTVDWVVMTAAVVGLGLTVVTGIQSSATDLSNGIGAQVTQEGTAALGQ